MFDRRDFISLTAVAGAASIAASTSAQDSKSSDKVRVGVMGLSRGQSLALDLAKLSGVEVATLCDVDKKRLDSFNQQFQEKTGTKPNTTSDFREMLADKKIDALVCAAPNHWHAPATIIACKAGKHVYVEKPCSHNPQEGEWMIEAAAKYKRCVQLGTQRRSSPGAIEAIEKTAQRRYRKSAPGPQLLHEYASIFRQRCTKRSARKLELCVVGRPRASYALSR